ncbi:hypothetical protein HY639_05450 [Candidatus Woesearchaeota archaeon]|nr:hypothetical protein [Candidatus Woesearchaeota archaeon]
MKSSFAIVSLVIGSPVVYPIRAKILLAILFLRVQKQINAHIIDGHSELFND